MVEPNKYEAVKDSTKPPPVQPVIEFSDLTCRIAPRPPSVFSSLFRRKSSPCPLTVLNGISGSVVSGETVAVIGTSGSGKSAFLNALTGTFEGTSTGTMKSKGEIVSSSDVRRMTSYMRQTGKFLPELSVYESIRYEALLKLPHNMAYSEKMERVEQVMESTGIKDCRTSRMSLGLDRVLSGGEVKRVMMASALVTAPHLLLLDEPTTGLDASRASAIVDLICQQVEQRQIAGICVAHQLSTQLLLKFNRLLIFCRGSLIYQGPPSEAVEYFQSLGFEKLPKDSMGEYLSSLSGRESCADTLIDCYKSNVRRLDSGRYACYFPSKQQDHTETNSSNPEKVAGTQPPTGVDGEVVPKRRASSLWAIKLAQYGKRQKTTTQKRLQGCIGTVVGFHWWHQTYWLFRRRLQQEFRRSMNIKRIAFGVFQTMLAGLIFFQLFRNLTDTSFLSVRGFIYFIPGFLSMTLMSSFITSYQDVGFYRLENSAKSYPTSSLLVACSAADVLIDQVIPSFYFITAYFMAGLPAVASVFLPSWLVLLVVCWVYRCVTNFVKVMSKSAKIFQVLLMTFVWHMWTFGGIIFPVSDLPPWLSWASWLSFVPYACDALFALMLPGQHFACGPDSVQSACPMEGEAFAATMSIHGLSVGQNIGALIGMGAVFSVCTYAFTRISPYMRRKGLGAVKK
eukprot:GHVS01060765.1.p1 GENE.GHVS01060765.1~~GHVS01060765.1.p1  ORF type:complete len:705 (+),score=43.02 GHVS01060765.1:80-2116(+)